MPVDQDAANRGTDEPRGRTLLPGQRSVVHIADTSGTVRELWSSDQVLVEAPNWTLDGAALLLNADGDLWRLPIDEPVLERVPTSGHPPLNNDHVLDPDGEHVFASANDWHLYRIPLAGGAAERITDGPDDRPGLMHFLHGISPDGRTLAFIGLEAASGVDGDFGTARSNVFTIRADGTDLRQVTDDAAPTDGSEFSPDGERLLFNTEVFDGHAQLARIRPDGTGLEQLTFDERVNWFPHPSPTGEHGYFLAYPPGTTGHPTDRPVEVELVEGDRWSEGRTIAAFNGGQGTLNVNGWDPTGERFAFVSYPIAG
ncbi:MAG TPA: biopolymer transporter Tol [Amnibacterium sp.]|jgi:Tol biopolymer transport system component|uniref:TolB family protein n=1 Tax=Amnibacterium sp. TaxID=1872496 RepID=UPI002F92EAFE